MILFIILLVLIVVSIILFIKYKIFTNYILNNFKSMNVIVAGKKRRGKDILFQWVINKRKKPYYANINYGGLYENVTFKDLSIEPNTYENFIENKVVKIPTKFNEKQDFYMSDFSLYAPSYLDSKLYKLYPSLPLFYPIIGHLYDSNIHFNCQNYERGWKALREQAEFFITVRKTIKLPFIFITFMTTYDKYSSAINDVRPIKTRLLNKFSKAQVDLYNAQNGVIKSGYIVSFKSSLKYNTRAFKDIILTNNNNND